MLLGIDLGTSSIKASLLDPVTGVCAASCSAPKTGELARTAPEFGWTEQNPEDWWQAAVEAIRSLPSDLVAKVSAIGIGYQMHGLVLVDADGRPVRPSIIWSDGRAVASGAKMAQEIPADEAKKLLNAPGNFTLAKLRWVRDNEPQAVERAVALLLPGDYLAMKLTGEMCTTSTGLSEMIAWNHVDRMPSTAAWESAGPLGLRPRVAPTLGVQGLVTAEASSLTGLPAGAKVSYRAGDQPNNAYSLAVFEPGALAAVAGTSGVLYGVGAEPVMDPQSRVNTFVHVTDTLDSPRSGVLMCVNGAGSSYSWLFKNGGFDSYDAMNLAAASVAPGAEGARCYPFGNGAERILENRVLGASFSGIDFTRHGASHMARATLEGVAMTMKYGMDILTDLGLTADVVRVGDASMFRSPEFCQLFTDLFGSRLEVFDTDGSLGAARAAGVGSGEFASPEESLASLRAIRSFEPDSAARVAYEEVYGKWKSDLAEKLV